MGKTLDVGELRGRRNQKLSILQATQSRVAQLEDELGQSKKNVDSLIGRVSELNELIAVVDPEGEEAKQLQQLGIIPPKELEVEVESGTELGSDNPTGDVSSSESDSPGGIPTEGEEVGEGHDGDSEGDQGDGKVAGEED